MKMDESKTMQKLHEIRANHYEETKNMSQEEFIQSVNERARQIIKKYNLRFTIIEKP